MTGEPSGASTTVQGVLTGSPAAVAAVGLLVLAVALLVLHAVVDRRRTAAVRG